MMQARFSTIDFIDKIVDFFDFSVTLLVRVESIGRIKSSIKLYITNIEIIRITDVDKAETKSNTAIHIQTHNI